MSTTAKEAVKRLSWLKQFQPKDDQLAIELAIAALRDSVPRVLELGELSGLINEPIWVETRYVNPINRWEIWRGFLTPVLETLYGSDWRCWSHKPSAEDMANTPWKERAE